MKPLLLDGQLKDSREAVISVYDHGFLYGMGLFETFRTYGGRPWLLRKHAERLAEGCAALGIAYRPDPDAMAAGVARLLEAGGLADAYIRWSVSAGSGEVGLPSGEYDRPREIVYAKPLAPDDPATRPGKALRLLRLRRSRPEIGELRLKSFHYMNNIAAKRELQAGRAAGTTEGVFLNERDEVVEGLVSNVFWIRDGELHTPSLDTGPLAGVTRSFVLDLARRQGIVCREDRYRWDELAQADEWFVTNSIQEIVPVIRLEASDGTLVRGDSTAADAGRGEASATPGPWTRRLMAAYRAAAEKGDEA
ncbi:aminotransferase class IV [Cohnella sp. JJ-181]|uniref:aminotransferase class IV n=1 Tax=Cohnella rhizoplanae TaxID=2974897 RepID=UPI0022FF7002|nr:aminotransferase class IV [Cohnella sp. JJ-181]CAI6084609.1 Branched-chain-amino-acid aminotransferase [Cohnella sp. JJ-181]